VKVAAVAAISALTLSLLACAAVVDASDINLQDSKEPCQYSCSCCGAREKDKSERREIKVVKVLRLSPQQFPGLLSPQ
jgi:hypothetical protein